MGKISMGEGKKTGIASEKVDLTGPVFISTYTEGLPMAGLVCVFGTALRFAKK